MSVSCSGGPSSRTNSAATTNPTSTRSDTERQVHSTAKYATVIAPIAPLNPSASARRLSCGCPNRPWNGPGSQPGNVGHRGLPNTRGERPADA